MKEWKAVEKETQKMTHDGAISVNMVTGEASRASDRAPEQDYSPSGDSAAFVHSAAERLDDRRIHKSEKKKRRKRRRSYREGTVASDCPSSRLQFTDEERAAPELQKAIRKSDKAADKLDAARAAVPEKQPSLHQPVNPLARPLQEIGHAAHAKVHEVEQENVGVEAGHLTERSMERAVRYGNRKLQNWQADRKLKPWREVSHAEQAAVQANAEALYQKALRENPQLAASNPISRMWQKKKLQKQYAAAYRAAHSAGDAAAAAQAASNGAKKSADAAKKAGEFVSKHKKAFLIVGGIGLLLVMLLGLLQSCSSIFSGGVSNIVASSYPAFLSAAAAYKRHSGYPDGLKKLKAHDENSQVSYLETLRVYLDNNLSVTKTAAALYLHRSTLLDRLAHITQMLGCDLKNPDFCLTLGILLRAELQQKRITQPKP